MSPAALRGKLLWQRPAPARAQPRLLADGEIAGFINLNQG
jgi:hypothetical protein